MSWLETIITVLGVIGSVWSVLFAYKAIFGIVGFFRYRRFRPAGHQHTYALCVPARNEETVICNFLDSVARQDYPLEKLTVFVIANNCTDGTARRAAAWQKNGLKAVVYERTNGQERTKGFALKYLFEQIEKDFGTGSFDGYFIFDADNVIAKNYITKMNDAFDEGNKIVTSFRSSKNANQNWISFSYAMHWMRTCLLENRGKSVLNQACRVQGTGFLFASELVKNGWRYTSLTEDRSFCSDAVVQNYRISYCDEAVFYDEQPYSLKIALRQRLRWAKGHLQSATENCPKLLQNMLSSRKTFSIAYDCFFLNFPRHIESAARKLLTFGLEIAVTVLAAGSFGWVWGGVIGWLTGLAGTWLGNVAIEILVLAKYGRRIAPVPPPPRTFVRRSRLKRLGHILLFPLFDIIGKWASYLALFQKVEWKPIPHESVVDVDSLSVP